MNDLGDLATHALACVVGCVAGSILATAVMLGVVAYRPAPSTSRYRIEAIVITRNHAKHDKHDKHAKTRVAFADGIKGKPRISRWLSDATIYDRGDSVVISEQPLNGSQFDRIVSIADDDAGEE